MLRLLAGTAACVQSAVDLVLPRLCGGCGRPATWWCPDCADRLRLTPSTHLLADGVTSCTSVGAYAGPGGAAVLAYKEHGAVALRRPLGEVLAQSVESAVAEADGGGSGSSVVLVPVPSRPSAVRRRGRDVVRELARTAARGLRADGHDVVVLPVLRHARAVRDQSGLDAVQRRANLSGALRVRAPRRLVDQLRARPRPVVVLVDDVVTTGATLVESARAVREVLPAGARVVAATVVRAGDTSAVSFAADGGWG